METCVCISFGAYLDRGFFDLSNCNTIVYSLRFILRNQFNQLIKLSNIAIPWYIEKIYNGNWDALGEVETFEYSSISPCIILIYSNDYILTIIWERFLSIVSNLLTIAAGK